MKNEVKKGAKSYQKSIKIEVWKKGRFQDRFFRIFSFFGGRGFGLFTFGKEGNLQENKQKRKGKEEEGVKCRTRSTDYQA